MADAHDQYGTIARFYDRVVTPLDRPLAAIALRMQPIGPGDRLLDVGCGTGAHLETYAATGATCEGVDLSPAMLAVAENRFDGSVQLTLGSATDLPHPPGSFDVVTGSMFLHELTPVIRREALAEMVRVTKPDGAVIVIDYHAGPLTIKGRALHTLNTVIERVAGKDHYTEFKRFLAEGGIGASLPEGSAIVQQKIVSGGNLAISIISGPQVDP